MANGLALCLEVICGVAMKSIMGTVLFLLAIFEPATWTSLPSPDWRRGFFISPSLPSAVLHLTSALDVLEKFC
jgi:hypothetical protein